jgi:hypothetical protein
MNCRSPYRKRRAAPEFRRPWLLCLVLLLIGSLPLQAARPRPWRQHTYKEFVAGEPTGITITGDGGLQLAPALETVAELEVERIWSLALGPDGRLYAGTGDSGQLYTIAADGQVDLLFDSPETALHSLVFGTDGNLYAGSAPDGLIYRIDPATGVATTFAHTGSRYVWDLLFVEDGQLCAAVGEPGKLLSISSDGEVESLYDPPDRHVICLAAAGDRLYAGTSQEARIYEIAADRARLLYAAPQQEIHDLLSAADGFLYASALPGEESTEKPATPSAVYRIAPDGAVTRIWQEVEATLIDLASAADLLMIATAEPDRLYRLDRRERAADLLRFEKLQPSRLLPTADGSLYIGAARSGSILRLAPGHRAEGQFDSAVEDFGAHARWGALTWRADLPKSTDLQLQTRSGNGESPDDTWSDWSDLVAESGAAISSPPARYLQYRVTLNTDSHERTPTLHGIRLFGQQTNLRPEIGQLEIGPYQTRKRSGNGSPDSGTPAQPGGAAARRPPHAKSLFLVRWQAMDPNGDKLSYRLYLRGIDQREWKMVEEDLEQTSALWDTETMPEGLTLLKLVASDHPDNPDGRALESERISPPFAIDNSPPLVEIEARQEGDSLRVEVEFNDRISPVYKAQYSVDYAERDYQIEPLDSLFDSRRERARFVVAGLPPGEHVIAVQAWDERENIGAQQIIVQIK